MADEPLTPTTAATAAPSSEPPARPQHAPGWTVAPSARFRAAHLAHLRAIAITLFRNRPWMVLPVFATNLGLLIASGYPTWRVVVVGCVILTGIVLQLVTAYVLSRTEETGHVFFKMSLMFAVLWSVVVSVTGGITSPFTPILLVLCASNIVAYGRSVESTVTVALHCALTTVLALLPSELVQVEVGYPYDVAIETTVLLTAFLLFGSNLVSLTDAFDRAGSTMERMSADLLAQARTRARSLESLSSRLAHELKNPLVAVKGLSQLLRRSAPDERTRERLEVIASEVTRMEEIIRDYLSFSKPLEAIDAAPVELGGLIDDVIGVLEARAAIAQVNLWRVPGAATVVGDRRRLKEALLNLVANAIEATPEGGGVHVGAEAIEAGARIIVRDSGRGMTPEELARLGTPFFTTRQGGTGLGVVLARAAFRQHGGDVVYESVPGKGTTAIGTLPNRPPTEAPLPGTA